MNLKRINSNSNVLVFLISIYTIFVLVFTHTVTPEKEILKLINSFDFVLCAGIFTWFILDLVRAHNKINFLKVGWLFIVAAIPAIWFFKELDIYIILFRLVVLFNLFRKPRHNNLPENEMSAPAIEAVLLFILALFIIVIASILVLHFENGAHGNIHSAEDAIWWAIVTIATVGYGDYYPVTMEGRVVAILLLFSGVSIFISLTSHFASQMRRSLPNNNKNVDGWKGRR